MAAISVPEPGSEVKTRTGWKKVGPCRPTCDHIDCLANRKAAESKCHLCGWMIGYDVAFYILADNPDEPKGNVHALCYELKIEAERKR